MMNNEEIQEIRDCIARCSYAIGNKQWDYAQAELVRADAILKKAQEE